VLALLVVACRPTGATDAPQAPFDHRRSDYVSRAHEPVGVARDLVAQLADAAPRSTATPSIVVDERLSVVAEEVAERSRDGRFVALPEMTTIARESGSLLFPLQAVALEPALLEPGWPDAVLASVGGRGPLAIGTSTPRDGAPVVLVFARSLVRLPNAVPAAGTTRLEIEIEIAPGMNAMTPELLLVGIDGTTHLPMTSVGERRFVADRPAGFTGRVAILGVAPTTAVGQSRNTSSELLASLHLGDVAQIGPAHVDALDDAIVAVREQWGQPALSVAAAPATPCGEPVLAIDAQPITLEQRCVTWTSAGTDAERWAAMLVNPLAIEALDDPRWQLAELRRDTATTTMRLGERFEELSEADAHARVDALVRERYPQIVHDAAADRGTTELARAWATEPLNDVSVDKHAELTAQAASRWSKQPRWFRATWSAQHLARVLDGVTPDATPTAYTLGIVRGVGPQGEPRWFVVLLFALPRA
jgi:hypothetical protein